MNKETMMEAVIAAYERVSDDPWSRGGSQDYYGSHYEALLKAVENPDLFGHAFYGTREEVEYLVEIYQRDH